MQHTTSVLWPFVRDYPGEPVPEGLNHSGFYYSRDDRVAVASAGPYGSQLHLASDRNHENTSGLKYFYRPEALPANQPTASKH